MKKPRLALLAACAALAASPSLAENAPDPVTPGSVIAASDPAEWVAIAPEDLLVMELAPDAQGNSRSVVIQLIPPPMSQGWVDNIRRLASAHWWDGTSVYRVVDNWVTQWGDVDEKKPLPEGLKEVPEGDYVSHGAGPEPGAPLLADAYAPGAGFRAGWPIAYAQDGASWPLHCYGHVGVARSLSPNTGSGSELYAVIGHAPRQLDRNIAVVGRVVEGMEHLSSLRRGTGQMGVYETPEETTPILSVRLASEQPAEEQPRFEYLDTSSASFAAYLEVKANRNDGFYRVPAGGVDICNVAVPIRKIEDGE